MKPEREHPAAPEQIEHGFDEGLGRRPRPPSDESAVSATASPPEHKRSFGRGVSAKESRGSPSLRRTPSNAASAKATSAAELAASERRADGGAHAPRSDVRALSTER